LHAVREVDPIDKSVAKQSGSVPSYIRTLASNCSQQQWSPLLLSGEKMWLAATCKRDASSNASYEKYSLIFPAPLAQFTLNCPENLLLVPKSGDKKHKCFQKASDQQSLSILSNLSFAIELESSKSSLQL
jgi:hypothetical protein